MRNSDDITGTGGSSLARETEVAAMISKTTTTAPGPTTADAAAAHLYDAECALHVAHQTHDDAWISAASEALHRALDGYQLARTGSR
jgi:hypothetical protein